MPAYFETGFFGGGVPAWHGLGTVIEDDVVEAARALELANLDWDVEMIPVQVPFHGQPVIIDGQFAVQRQTDGKALGIVQGAYTPIQNREAFAWCDEIVGSGEAKYHTAGSLKGGSRTWLLAKLSRDLLIGGIESERIEQYLMLANSFDGSLALTAKLTRVRVVCANTLEAALSGGGREFKIRHVGQTLDGRMEEARRVLEITFADTADFVAEAERLLGTKLTRADFTGFLENLIPISEDAAQRTRLNREAQREAIAAIYSNAGNLADVRGTAWAAYNAVAEYHDHHARVRSSASDPVHAEDSRMENRMLRIMGDWSLKDKAKALLAA